MAVACAKYNEKLSVSHKLLAWAIRHAGWILNRFQVHADGMTSYRRLKGVNYRGEVVEFAECVWARIPGRTRTDKLEPRWTAGVWVGKVESSDEHLVGTSTGIVRARSIMRRPEPERWDQEIYRSMVGRPWSISGGLADTVVAERRKYITPKVVSKYGATANCKACVGQGPTHTEYCRSRFVDLFAKEEEVNVGPVTPATTATTPRPEVEKADGAEAEVERVPQQPVPKVRVAPPTKPDVGAGEQPQGAREMDMEDIDKGSGQNEARKRTRFAGEEDMTQSATAASSTDAPCPT